MASLTGQLAPQQGGSRDGWRVVGFPSGIDETTAGSLEAWEHAALTRAAGAFELERDRPILLILRISRSDPPSVRSLRRPIDEVLAFV